MFDRLWPMCRTRLLEAGLLGKRLRWLLLGVTILCLSVPSALALPTAAQAQADEAEWLIMLYSDADDNILEEDIMIDLQEAELVGSTDQVTIASDAACFDAD